MLPRFDLDQADRAWGHVLRRLPAQGPEHDLWTAWDLANLVEGGLGEIIDGRTLDLEARGTWAARLGGDRVCRRAAAALDAAFVAATAQGLAGPTRRRSRSAARSGSTRGARAIGWR